jgi:multidrug efflux pump subunit AcrB
MDGYMIEFFVEFYNFILSGAAISLLVAVLFIWYCIHRDMKEREAFDEKYRKNRNLTNKEWKR